MSCHRHYRQYVLGRMLHERLERYNDPGRYSPLTYAKMQRLVTRAYFRELGRIFPRIAAECADWEARA